MAAAAAPSPPLALFEATLEAASNGDFAQVASYVMESRGEADIDYFLPWSLGWEGEDESGAYQPTWISISQCRGHDYRLLNAAVCAGAAGNWSVSDGKRATLALVLLAGAVIDKDAVSDAGYSPVEQVIYDGAFVEQVFAASVAPAASRLASWPRTRRQLQRCASDAERAALTLELFLEVCCEGKQKPSFFDDTYAETEGKAAE
jgi:hypothetical protein